MLLSLSKEKREREEGMKKRERQGARGPTRLCVAIEETTGQRKTDGGVDGG